MLNTRDRGGALTAVIAIHAALLFAFLNLSGTIEIVDPQRVMRVFDVTETPPPPVEEPPPPPPKVEKQRAPEEAAPAAPQNIRSKATPVVAPKPRVQLPIPLPVNTTETPNQGAAPTQGAGDVRGPGTGAGGSGSGTGAGGAGSGAGGGGGEPASPVRLVRGITNRDYPNAIQRRWPRGGRIFLRLRVEADGRPSKCDVMRSFGNPAADQWTCSLVLSRGQFRPATNDRGVPIAAWFGYIQSDTGRFER